jgi:hypothetical protein
MQLQVPSNREDVAWAKILVNIIFIDDAEKLENATNSEWCRIVCHCLSILVDPSRCSKFHLPYELSSIEANHFGHTVDAPLLLTVVSPTTLKLSSLPGTPVFDEL